LTTYIVIKFPHIENKQYTDTNGLILDKNHSSVTPEFSLASMSVSLSRVKWLSLTIFMKSFYLI